MPAPPHETMRVIGFTGPHWAAKTRWTDAEARRAHEEGSLTSPTVEVQKRHCATLSLPLLLSVRQASCSLQGARRLFFFFFLTNGSVEKSERRKNEIWTIWRLYLNAFPPGSWIFHNREGKQLCVYAWECVAKDWNKGHLVKSKFITGFILLL